MRMILMVLLAMPAFAAAGQQAAPAPATSVTNLAPMLVSGEQPGPGLWKVSSPAGHVLWVLGTLDPLPSGMQWQSREVLARLGEAQELVGEPGIRLKAKLGFFGSLALLPRLIGIRNNPDHAKLADIVPPATYARWLALKARYIGHSNKVEKWRPLFAGMRLYEDAIKRSGLDSKGVVPMLLDAAKQHGLKPTPAQYVVTVDDPKALLKDFRRERIDDLACFEAMLDRVDTDLAGMTARANAWATGDLVALRQLSFDHAGMPCSDAVSGTGFARQLGLQDIRGKQRQAWLDEARRALAAHATSFALLPIDDALPAAGYLAAFKADGDRVEAPDEADPTDDPAAPAAAASAPAGR